MYIYYQYFTVKASNILTLGKYILSVPRPPSINHLYIKMYQIQVIRTEGTSNYKGQCCITCNAGIFLVFQIISSLIHISYL